MRHIVVFLLIIIAVMAAPQMPTQIYGDANGVSDGTVILFKINNTQYVSSIVSSGKYGYSSLVYFPNDDPATSNKEGFVSGDTIDLFIGSTKVASTNETGLTFKIDFTYSTSVTSSGGSGGGGSRSGTRSCNPEWSCGDWQLCINGVQKRSCYDSKYCGILTDKPATTQTCQVANSGYVEPITPPPSLPEQIQPKPVVREQTVPVQKPYDFTWVYWALGLMLIVLVIGYLVVLLIKHPIHFEKKEIIVSMPNKDILEHIKKARALGYADDEIMHIFIQEGWDPELIIPLVKKTEV